MFDLQQVSFNTCDCGQMVWDYTTGLAFITPQPLAARGIFIMKMDEQWSGKHYIVCTMLVNVTPC